MFNLLVRVDYTIALTGVIGIIVICILGIKNTFFLFNKNPLYGKNSTISPFSL